MLNNVDLFGNEVDNVDKTIMALGILLAHVLKVPGVRNVLKSMINFLKKGAGSTVKLFADAGKGSFHGINIFEDLGGDFLESAGEIVESAYVLG